MRRAEDITEVLWGTRVSTSTVSELNQKVAGQIEGCRNQPIAGEHAYFFPDGVWLKRSWGSEVRDLSHKPSSALANPDQMRATGRTQRGWAWTWSHGITGVPVSKKKGRPDVWSPPCGVMLINNYQGTGGL